MLQGLIFDFNGTLFWDTDKHDKAWQKMAKQLRGYPLDDEEMRKNVHGRTNRLILQYLMGDSFDEQKVETLGSLKEQLYRALCLEDQTNLKLAPGAVELFVELSANNIPFTIATSSEKENVDFFFEVFGLDQWFDRKSIVYANHSLPSKPDPEIFLRAFEKLGLTANECGVVEDAPSGLLAARRAQAGKVIAVGPGKRRSELQALDGVDWVVEDFFELRDKLFS